MTTKDPVATFRKGKPEREAKRKEKEKKKNPPPPPQLLIDSAKFVTGLTVGMKILKLIHDIKIDREVRSLRKEVNSLKGLM